MQVVSPTAQNGAIQMLLSMAFQISSYRRSITHSAACHQRYNARFARDTVLAIHMETASARLGTKAIGGDWGAFRVTELAPGATVKLVEARNAGLASKRHAYAEGGTLQPTILYLAPPALAGHTENFQIKTLSAPHALQDISQSITLHSQTMRI